jgi:hypothetical protein
LAHEQWGFKPSIRLEAILEEIAAHADNHPNWLNISATQHASI